LNEPTIDVNKREGSWFNMTVLELACMCDQVDIIKAMLTHSDIEIGKSLHYTVDCTWNGAETLKLLLDHMQKQGIQNKVDVTDELYLSCKTSSYEVFVLLLTHPITTFDINKHPLIHTVCHTSRLEQHKVTLSRFYPSGLKTEVDKLEALLLLADIDVNQKGPDGLTPLQVCAEQKHLTKFKLLLSNPRYDVHVKATDGRTVFDIVNS
jgi:ankyrin repeat protein